MSINLQVDQAKVSKIRDHIGTIAGPAAERIVAQASDFGRKAAAEGAPQDTGAISRDIMATVHGLSAKVHTGLAGAVTVEYGRRSGSALPPVSAIKAWAQRHGIDESLAYPIARAIARRGIKGRFFMKRAAEQLRNIELPRLLKQTAREIESAWGRL